MLEINILQLLKLHEGTVILHINNCNQVLFIWIVKGQDLTEVFILQKRRDYLRIENILQFVLKPKRVRTNGQGIRDRRRMGAYCTMQL